MVAVRSSDDRSSLQPGQLDELVRINDRPGRLPLRLAISGRTTVGWRRVESADSFFLIEYVYSGSRRVGNLAIPRAMFGVAR